MSVKLLGRDKRPGEPAFRAQQQCAAFFHNE
jgi:hypothetical protein